MDQILIIISAIFTLFWGIAHLFPTKGVVKAFGDISIDNKRIITMEWILEGVTLIFLGSLTAIIAFVDITNEISHIVFIAIAIMLFVMALVSMFTGFKVKFLPYKLCPIIFSVSAILILVGVFAF